MLSSPVHVYVNNKKYITLPHKMIKTIKLDSITGNTILITAKYGSSTAAVDGNQQLYLNGYSTMRLSSNKILPTTFLIHSKGRSQSLDLACYKNVKLLLRCIELD
jgi:hypothetical protein